VTRGKESEGHLIGFRSRARAERNRDQSSILFQKGAGSGVRRKDGKETAREDRNPSRNGEEICEGTSEGKKDKIASLDRKGTSAVGKQRGGGGGGRRGRF